MEIWKGGVGVGGAGGESAIGGAACSARHAAMAAGPERADSDAPGELLAEFLSAIMRRQYAEALKCCRLILQYEPHNATARGFYPLLQHKLRACEDAEAASDVAEDMEDAHGDGGATNVGGTGGVDGADRGASSPAACVSEDQQEEAMEQEESGGSRSRSGSADWCGSQSSLELDSSDAPVPSSPSRSLSRRTDLTDTSKDRHSPSKYSREEPTDYLSASGGSGASVTSAATGASGASGASGEFGAWSGAEASSASGLSASEGSAARWDSTATEPDTDDNGNPPAQPARPAHTAHAAHDDVQNDNAGAECAGAALRVPHLKSIFYQKLGLRR